MDELLKQLFEETKENFLNVLKHENSKKLFELIDKINVYEYEKEGDHNHRLSVIMSYFSDINFHEIYCRHTFSYILEMIEFLRYIKGCIDGNRVLYFLKITSYRTIKAKTPKVDVVYTFSSRYFEYDKDIKEDFYKNSPDHKIFSIERIKINYENLFQILNEIVKDENWKYESDLYWFNHEKAFDKYFNNH